MEPGTRVRIKRGKDGSLLEEYVNLVGIVGFPEEDNPEMTIVELRIGRAVVSMPCYEDEVEVVG